MKLNKYLIIFVIAISSISLIGCSKNNDQSTKEELQTTFNTSNEELEEYIESSRELEKEKENNTTINIHNSKTQDLIQMPDKQLTRDERKEKYIKLLIGSWKSQKDGTLEFLEDGTFTYLSSKNKTYDGKWEIDTTADPYIIINISVKSALAAGHMVVDAENQEYIGYLKPFSISIDEQGFTVLYFAAKAEILEGYKFTKIE